MILAGALGTAAAVSGAPSAHPDSLGVSLGEVEVSDRAPLARVGADGVMRFGREALGSVPQMFGEADPLRYMNLLPGMTTISDYSSGSSADGMAYSQNSYSLNGIPVNFPYHFGGIFSVFNPRLYRDAKLEKSVRGAAGEDVLGAVAGVESGMSPRRDTTGELNAGMLSSSGYLAVPLAGGKVSVEAAARVSYINALYDSFLRMDGSQARYDFGDFDAVVNYAPTGRDKLRGTVHYNRDHVTYDDVTYSLMTLLRWRNTAAGIDWRHEGDHMTMTHSACYTGFSNRLGLDMGQIRLSAPTSIDRWGVKGVMEWGELADRLELSAGYSAELYRIVPQGVELSGFGSGSSNGEQKRGSGEVKLWGEVKWHFAPGWSLRGGLALPAYFGDDGYRVVTADPRVTVTRRMGRGDLSFHVGRYHQFLHQVGFSEMGMSSNFRIGATSSIPAQESWNFVVTGGWRPAEWLSLTLDGYWKRVLHDPEYTGAVLDIVDPDYKCDAYITSPSGFSTGANLMARVETGRVWGMAGYGFAVARRRSPLTGAWFNAASDVRHSLTASAGWQITAHWSLTSTFSYASGRRVTPVTAVYFIADRLMMEYGERNSARLPAYHRLDVGASYRFHSGGRLPLDHEVSLSVLNAYGHRNVEMQTMRIDATSGRYERRSVGSLFRWLPSLSYMVRF